MSSYSPTLSHGDAVTSSLEAAVNAAIGSSPSSSKTPAHHHHNQGLFSKLRKQAPRLFAKSKSARPSSGHSYLRGGKGGGPCIQSEPPSFTGYSTDQDQELSQSTSPKTSRPESSSGFFQTAITFNTAAVATTPVPSSTWHQVTGQPGCWSFGNNNAQQTLQIKQTSMLVLTEVEKSTLREIALQILLKDNDLHSKMAPYIERFNPNNQNASADAPKKSRHGGGSGVSRFFSRLSHLRFSTGSYSSANPPQRGGGLLHRAKGRSKNINEEAPSQHSPLRLGISTTTSAEPGSSNLVFGATLKRCLANEILAERKRLMRLERLSRSGRLPPSRRLEPLPSSSAAIATASTNQKDSLLRPPQEKPSNGTNSRQHLPLNRRSSVNGIGLSSNNSGQRSNEKAVPVIHHENNVNNDMVNDDADSGFQEDNEVPSVKATSFDTGRRFERCGESAGPMPLQVPQFVKKCVHHIETYGMDVEGIFRLGASKKRIRSQIAEIQRSADFNFTEDNSVHDTAALLKEFFRDLPEPLLTRSLYAAFVAVGTIQDKTGCQSLLRLLILLLPSVHRDTLYFLLVFLRNVASHALSQQGGNSTVGGNKMTSHNLATLFGPNILRFSASRQGEQTSSRGNNNSRQQPDGSADMESAFTTTATLKSGDQLNVTSSATLPRKGSEHFVVESQERADERLAVIEVVQILIENCETIFQIPIELMDQMFVKMFQGDFSSTRHNSMVVKTKHAWIAPSTEVIQRLLFKRAGERSMKPGGAGEGPLIVMMMNSSNNDDCCCSTYQPSQHTSCYNNDSTLLSCTSFSVQSSPTAPEKANRNEAVNDEGSTRPTAEEFVTASLHPNVTACVSRSEGDLTSGRRTFDLVEDDPRYFRLTGRPRPRRYGESYAAKIRINTELIQAASTWDELRTAIAQNPRSYSNTMPRITVTVAPSSAPDTPIPSQARA